MNSNHSSKYIVLMPKVYSLQAYHVKVNDWTDWCQYPCLYILHVYKTTQLYHTVWSIGLGRIWACMLCRIFLELCQVILHN